MVISDYKSGLHIGEISDLTIGIVVALGMLLGRREVNVSILMQIIEIALAGERIDNFLFFSAEKVQEGLPQPTRTILNRKQSIASHIERLGNNGDDDYQSQYKQEGKTAEKVHL